MQHIIFALACVMLCADVLYNYNVLKSVKMSVHKCSDSHTLLKYADHDSSDNCFGDVNAIGFLGVQVRCLNALIWL